MPLGLEIYDANATLVSSTGHRWGRYLGSVLIPRPTGDTSTWVGYIEDYRLADGEFFAYVTGTGDSFILYPLVTSVGPTTLKWDFQFQESIGGTSIYDPRALTSVLIRYGVR